MDTKRLLLLFIACLMILPMGYGARITLAQELCQGYNIWVQEIDLLLEEFDRTMSQATFTIQSVAALQQTRRDFTVLPMPDCGKELHDAMLSMLNNAADGVVLRLSGNDPSSQQFLDAATTDRQTVENILNSTVEGTPPQPRGAVIIASYDGCGVPMPGEAAAQVGAAYDPPNTLADSYPQHDKSRGCAAELEYSLTTWAAFWHKVDSMALAGCANTIMFDAKADPPISRLKVEIKTNAGVSIGYVTNLGPVWKNYTLAPSNDFQPALNSLGDVAEIVFTLERPAAPPAGKLWIDVVICN